MDEVLELQRQLAAVQSGTTSQKLSERNCVELVMKLQALNLIDLIFTRSGKEYLTHKQLVIEIEDELLTRGGRVNVIDLPDALNIELVHIQSKIPEIILAANETTRLVRGELLTDYYLASIAEEINDAITSSEHGIDDIGSIASRYALPVDVIRETVQLHLGTVIDATLDAQNPDLIRSAASIQRDRAAARGLLQAVTSPTVLYDIANTHKLPFPLVSLVVDDMLEAGDLSGFVAGKGNRSVLVPKVFSTAAVHAALSAFGSNGIIVKARIEKMCITDIETFVEEHLPEAIVLNACIVNPSLIDTLATTAAEAVLGGTWLDIESALPPDFPERDVSLVLLSLKQSVSMQNGEDKIDANRNGTKSVKSRRKAKATQNSASKADVTSGTQLFFGERFVVSAAFSKKVSDKLLADAKEKAKERACLMSENMSTVVTDSTPSIKHEAAPSDTGKKAKGKGRRRAGGKEKPAKQGNSVSAPSNANDPPIAVPSLEDAVEIVLSEQEFCRVVEVDYLGSSTAGEDMLSYVMEEIYGDVQSQYVTIAEEALRDLMRERMVAKMNREKALLAGLEQAEQYFEAAASLPEDELAIASRLWVRDEICVNALCRVLDSVAQANGIIETSLVKAHELSSKKEKIEVVRAFLSKLAPPLEVKLRSFVNLVGDKDTNAVPNFLEMYDENTSLLDLPARRPLDRKAEKSLHTKARTEMKQSLKHDSGLSPKEVLTMAIALVHADDAAGVIVQVPSDVVTGFCKTIEERAQRSPLGEKLRAVRAAVELLEDEDNEGPADEKSVSGMREKVASLLAELA